MHRRKGFFLILLIFVAPSFSLAEEPSFPEAVPGQVLVRVPENLPLEDVRQVAASVEAQVERRIAPWGLYLFRFDETSPVSDVVQRLKSHPAVQNAEPNLRLKISFHRADEHLIDTPGAGPAPGVVVAIIDTGIDLEHPFLRDRIFQNLGEIPSNGIDDDGNGFIDDFHGFDFYDQDPNPRGGFGFGSHGTEVAVRVVAGALDAPVAILPLRVGPGPFLSLDAVIEAIVYAADMGARIINMSFGGYFSSAELEEAVNYVADRGVLLVAAAGNEGISDAPIPAAYGGVLAVAASDSLGRKASFSNFGDWVDFTAPGTGVRTTTYGGWFATVDGTSFSAPFVAGVAARILASEAGMTSLQLIERLRSFSSDINAINPDFQGLLGFGLIDPAVASRVAQNHPLSRELVEAVLAGAQGQVQRLEAALAVVEQQLAQARQGVSTASQELATAFLQVNIRWRQYLDAWTAYLRSRAATFQERSRLLTELQTARVDYLQALAQHREALSRFRVALADVGRTQARRSDLTLQLSLARRRVNELSRLSNQRISLTSHQLELHTLLKKIRSIEEILEGPAFPEALKIKEVPQIVLPSSFSRDPYQEDE